MKHEIWNGSYLGSAEWTGPGAIEVDMANESDRRWFQRYFDEEQSYLSGTVDCPEMTSERPSDSEEAFNRSLERLPAFNYDVRRPPRTLRAKPEKARR